MLRFQVLLRFQDFIRFHDSRFKIKFFDKFSWFNKIPSVEIRFQDLIRSKIWYDFSVSPSPLGTDWDLSLTGLGLGWVWGLPWQKGRGFPYFLTFLRGKKHFLKYCPNTGQDSGKIHCIFYCSRGQEGVDSLTKV